MFYILKNLKKTLCINILPNIQVKSLLFVSKWSIADKLVFALEKSVLFHKYDFKLYMTSMMNYGNYVDRCLKQEL